MANRYCSVNQVKQYLDISGTSDDEIIGMMIDAAVTDIDNYTRRNFMAITDTTRTFDAYADTWQGGDRQHWQSGYNGRYLPTLKGYTHQTLYLDADLCQITSITNGDGTTVTASQYTTNPRNVTPYYAIELLPSASIAWEPDSDGNGQDAISIVGRWGYSVQPPAAIQFACMRLAAFKYRKKDNQMETNAILPGGVVIAPRAIPADVASTLKSYVRQLNG